MFNAESSSNGTQRPLDSQVPPLRDVESLGPAANEADGQGEQAPPAKRPSRRRSSPRPPGPIVLPSGGEGILLRDVEPDDVAEQLRGMLGLPPQQPAPGEAAASFRRSMPPVVHGLDAGGWIAWCLVGLLVFGERFPPIALVRSEAKRVTLALAMLRAKGTVTTGARVWGASRKVLRENLRAMGLYPWRNPGGADEGAVDGQ